MIKYALLGAVQGVTEFLPVSSSGHLIIAQKALGISGSELFLQLVLHLATVLAVVMFFWKEIRALFSDRKMLMLVLVTTAVTGAVGIIFHDFFTGLFFCSRFLAPQLAFTGIILLASGMVRSGGRSMLGYGDAVVVGLAQALGIVPAISRSGMTIASMLFRKIDRNVCFTFSFLVSVPAVIGASLFELKGIGEAVHTGFAGMAVGFVSSFATGIASLWLLKKMVVSGKFHYFGYYCLALAAVLFIVIK